MGSFRLTDIGILSQKPIPIQIPNMVFWLGDKVNNGVARTTLSNGTLITQWDDLSGNGYHHIIQNTGKPQYDTTEQAIEYTGNSCMLSRTGVTFAIGYHTLFLVLKTSSNNKFYNNFMWINGGFTANDYFYYAGASSSVYNSTPAASSNSSAVNCPNPWLATGAKCLGVRSINGTHASHKEGIRKNGNAVTCTDVYTATPDGTSRARTSFAGGIANTGTGSITGFLYEQILYSRALSAAEITEVEGYLNSKYSIY